MRVSRWSEFTVDELMTLRAATTLIGVQAPRTRDGHKVYLESSKLNDEITMEMHERNEIASDAAAPSAGTA